MEMTTANNRPVRKLKKTVVFMVIDMVLVFILTWFWFYVMATVSVEGSVMDKWSHGAQSAAYTVFITACFGVYYFIFDLYWRRIDENIIEKI